MLEHLYRKPLLKPKDILDTYGIQVETPEHFLDATQSIGTQLRKLITADISDDTILEVANIKLTKKGLDFANIVFQEFV